MRTHTPSLGNGLILLRAFAERDLDAVRQASHDPAIQELTGLDPAEPRSARAYLTRQGLRAERGLGHSWAVVEQATSQTVGQIGLWWRAVAPDGSTGYLEEAHGRAALGYWTLPMHRGRGFATAALATVSRWALGLNDVDRLELFIEPANTASRRAAEATGYRREGLLRSFQRIGETRRDMLLYARLRNEPADP